MQVIKSVEMEAMEIKYPQCFQLRNKFQNEFEPTNT